MEENARFLSCDWGTSSFRLKLVEASGLKILADVDSDEGIAHVFQLWKQSGKDKKYRIPFYISIIQKSLQRLEKHLNTSLDDIPLVISGMASSSIGMAELPYKELPFSVDGSDLKTKIISGSDEFRHKTLLISGARFKNDVMRGEETQLLGGMADSVQESEQMLIHPGTHCKHIEVKNGKAVAFKTYMTGEFFSLLTNHSILSDSLKKSGQLHNPNNLRSFEKGVKSGSNANLLHQCFMVRTNHLFKELSLIENYYYLSGLLIGYELSDFPENYSKPICLSGEPVLMEHYLQAMKLLGISEKATPISTKNADLMTLKGQMLMLHLLNK